MNYLTPEIAKHAKYGKHASKKSLAKPSVSCGIFQDCFNSDLKYSEKLLEFNRNEQ